MSLPASRARRGALATLITLVLGSGTLAACGQGGNEVDIDVQGTPTPSAGAAASTPATPDGVPQVVATVATGLAVPWGIDFLPDGRAVVTERRSARVLLVSVPKDAGAADADGVQGDDGTAVGTVETVGRLRIARPRGEGGLLGVAVSPSFATDGLLYFYVTTGTDNRVVRARLTDGRLGRTEPVLTGIPAAANHDGGRLVFGPDGYLYVATGDALDPQAAQDPESLAGKILRITTDGAPAPQNPFDSPVWSLGHRNVQGLAFDADGSLWASEFGDDTADELNRILPGGNYGWPEVEGAGEGADPRFTAPALTWATEDASPSGLAFTPGRLWMAALRGARLWSIPTTSGRVDEPTAYLQGDGGYGRLRSVVRAPDGRLWLATSNTDGRGEPRDGDDRILLVDP